MSLHRGRPRAAGLALATTAAASASLLTTPTAHAELSDPAEIYYGAIQTDEIVLGPNESTTFHIDFAVRDDSGMRVSGATATLHGPGGRTLEATTTYPGIKTCMEISDTAAVCSFLLTVDTGEAEIDNGYAGTWSLSAMAFPKDTAWDGTPRPEGTVTADNLDTVTFKRDSKLSSDASPNVASPGRTISVIGELEFADWTSGGYAPGAGQPLDLVFAPDDSPYYQYVDELTTYSNGWAFGSGEAEEDGSWFLAYQGSPTTEWVYSPFEHINVRGR
ncbi:hypothetical protein [Salinactinospora qingdaonensis]|uniref:Uncharacterized protein n=1 Tax=Salinactinospora qingdaonensis TaxID=702744 RepID=A0ABP7GEX8_9ACTN